MGLTAVLNDTPEKQVVRNRLLTLLEGKAFSLSSCEDDPSHFTKVISAALSAGLSEFHIARVCRIWDPDDVREWALGSIVPDPAWQERIVDLVRGELQRLAAAVEHD